MSSECHFCKVYIVLMDIFGKIKIKYDSIKIQIMKFIYEYKLSSNICFSQRHILDIEMIEHFVLFVFNDILNFFRATCSHETFHSRPI